MSTSWRQVWVLERPAAHCTWEHMPRHTPQQCSVAFVVTADPVKVPWAIVNDVMGRDMWVETCKITRIVRAPVGYAHDFVMRNPAPKVCIRPAARCLYRRQLRDFAGSWRPHDPQAPRKKRRRARPAPSCWSTNKSAESIEAISYAVRRSTGRPSVPKCPAIQRCSLESGAGLSTTAF